MSATVVGDGADEPRSGGASRAGVCGRLRSKRLEADDQILVAPERGNAGGRRSQRRSAGGRSSDSRTKSVAVVRSAPRERASGVRKIPTLQKPEALASNGHRSVTVDEVSATEEAVFNVVHTKPGEEKSWGDGEGAEAHHEDDTVVGVAGGGRRSPYSTKKGGGAVR